MFMCVNVYDVAFCGNTARMRFVVSDWLATPELRHSYTRNEAIAKPSALEATTGRARVISQENFLKCYVKTHNIV